MLFNISLLLDQIFVMLLGRYVSLCIILLNVIGLLSNTYILCYLKGTTLYGLHITRVFLHDFIDVNWVSSVDDRKSTVNYVLSVSRQYTYLMEVQEAKNNDWVFN